MAAILNLNQNPLFQSPYTYLQGSGSDNSDGSARGAHLRWHFLRRLGDTHLPKGFLSNPTGNYPTTIGFNKDNDFVNIYRAEYINMFEVEVNFQNAPSVLIEIGSTREWHYNGFVTVPSAPANTTNVIVLFTDIAQYDTIRNTVNPNTNSIVFIQRYRGIIEIKTNQKLMFSGLFTLNVQPGSTIQEFRVEAVSLLHDRFDQPDNKMVSCRRNMTHLDTPEDRTIICENISYFRFSYDIFYPTKIKLAAYVDHIIGENQPGHWAPVSQFSLTINDSQAFSRLEDGSNYVIDKEWPKYNEDDAGTGAFK